MKHLYRYVGLLAVFILFPLAASAKGSSFTAHEWGTFTSLVGSNGKTQNGMYHEDEPLPSFVHGFGELVSQPIFQPQPDPGCQHSKIPCDFIANNIVTQKMETPVIYFYNNTGAALNATIDVKFPEGAISETYPGPTFTTPTRNSAPVLANGHTVFNVNVLPQGFVPSDVRIPYVESGNIYAHARNVDSSLVRANDELEKFIFYRGAGRFQPEMSIRSEYGALRIGPDALGQVNPHMFLIDVSSAGEARAINLLDLGGKSSTYVDAQTIAILRDHTQPASGRVMDPKFTRGSLVRALLSSGLTYDEAEAMINTWEHGYLRVPGLRLLYVLPASEVERILPLSITPQPEELRRVFVGRIEVMLDTDERALMYKVLAAGDLIDVTLLGRFGESMLRRTLEVYNEHRENMDKQPDPKVVELFGRLIQRAATAGLN